MEAALEAQPPMGTEMYPTVIGIFALICVLCFLWRLDKSSAKKQERRTAEWEARQVGEENVLKAQLEFEKRLDEHVDLPDVIRWRKAFIYRNLMRKWFACLNAKYRYDEAMSKKIRSDWLSYLDLLEHHQTAVFLASEGSNEDKHDRYEQEAWESKERYKDIKR